MKFDKKEVTKVQHTTGKVTSGFIMASTEIECRKKYDTGNEEHEIETNQKAQGHEPTGKILNER